MQRTFRLPRRGRRRPFLNDLPRRAYLTVKHHGWQRARSRAWSPRRCASSGWSAGRGSSCPRGLEERRVRAWYRREGRHVTIVMPTYGDPATTIDAVRRLRRTLRPGARSDRCRRRRERAAPPGTIWRELDGRRRARPGAREPRLCGQREPRACPRRGGPRRGRAQQRRHRSARLARGAAARGLPATHAGVVGPMLVYPDGRIQAAGAHRNLGAPEWFDHRYRFKRPDHGPANVPDTALAVTGACMYLRRALIDELGSFDEDFPMAYEDVDYCLRAWEAGWDVRYEPGARLDPRRVAHAGHRGGRARAPLAGPLLGQVGRLVRPPRRAQPPTAACGSST